LYPPDCMRPPERAVTHLPKAGTPSMRSLQKYKSCLPPARDTIPPPGGRARPSLGGTCVRSRGAHTPAGTPGLSIGLFRQNRRKGTSGRNPSDKPTTTLINHTRAHSPPLRGRIFPLLRRELFGEPPCIPPWILSASSNGSFDKKIPRFFPGDFIKIAPLPNFMDELSILS
jgi:hypothetical protein